MSCAGLGEVLVAALGFALGLAALALALCGRGPTYRRRGRRCPYCRLARSGDVWGPAGPNVQSHAARGT